MARGGFAGGLPLRSLGPTRSPRTGRVAAVGLFETSGSHGWGRLSAAASSQRGDGGPSMCGAIRVGRCRGHRDVLPCAANPPQVSKRPHARALTAASADAV